MRIYAKTDIGKVRQTNQDSCFVREFDADCGYALVCDGMGGHQGGNIASSLATSTIEKELQQAMPTIRRRSVEKLLTSVLVKANDAVFSASLKDPSLKGMGTTAVITFILDSDIYIAHVGDSRVYGFDCDGKAVRLTKDHSVVQEMVDIGEITEQQATVHPYKHIITRSVGISADVKVDTAVCAKEKFRKLLLCSDGLSNLVSTEEMEKIMADTDISRAADSLVDLANSHGGNDNITVIVVDCFGGGNDR